MTFTEKYLAAEEKEYSKGGKEKKAHEGRESKKFELAEKKALRVRAAKKRGKR